MLLLNPGRKISFLSLWEIYIPLCFYLIPLCQKEILWSLSIYIPLCFYLIKNFRADWEATRLIYIPLCFYLIEEVNGVLKLKTNLHSTMLLLNREAISGRIFLCLIYIPLCFYLICLPSASLHDVRFIYIPLCFYLILDPLL